MKVKELIARLQLAKNQDAIVVILGEYEGRIEKCDGGAISSNYVGQVIDYEDEVAITRVIG